MVRRAVFIGALAVALAGPTAWPAEAEQGKGRHKAHVVKVKNEQKGHKGQGKGKVKVKPHRGAHAGDWTDEQRARLTPMLPPGLTLERAAAGFRNRGQFIAALNASREHNVSFHELKHLMVDRDMSLGQALQTLRR